MNKFGELGKFVTHQSVSNRSSTRACLVVALLIGSLACFDAWLCPKVVHAAGDLDNQLTQIVRSAGILSPDIGKSAIAVHQSTANGFTVTISTYRNNKASDNDCKIDAVLIAKRISDRFPKQAQDIMVVFYDLSRTFYRSITIRRGDLSVFSSGALSKDKFLQMLTIVKNQNKNYASPTSIAEQVMNYRVPDGAYKIQRQQMLLNLQDIVEHHGDVSTLWTSFQQLERLVQAGQMEEFALGQAKLARSVTEAVNQAHEQYDAQLGEAQRQARAETSAQVTQDAERLAANGQVHPGLEYRRRERLASVIQQRRNQGIDVNIYSQILYGEIENKAISHAPDLDQSITQLETALGLPPLR